MAMEMLTMTDSLCILPKKLTELSTFSSKLRFLETSIKLPRRNVAFWSRRSDRDRPDFWILDQELNPIYHHWVRIIDKHATRFTNHQGHSVRAA